MSKSRTQKEELIKKYKDLIESKSGYLLVNSDKIDTTTVTKLKIALKDIGGNFTVIKNSIFKIALQDSKQPLQVQDFDGPTAIIAYDQDPTAPAKLVKTIQKELELLTPRSGVYEGEFLDANRVMQLADIPSKDVLLSRLVGSMHAPLTGFMHALTGTVSDFTMILQGLSEKK